MKKTQVAILDQGEFVGGAELYILEMLQENHQYDVTIIGGESIKYQNKIPRNIRHIPFTYPSGKGNIFKKVKATWNFFCAGYRIAQILSENKIEVVISNTSRTHFTVWCACVLGKIPQRWISIFHDWTVPSRILRGILKKSNIAITVSKRSQEYIMKHTRGENPTKVIHISNSIETSKHKISPPAQVRQVLVLGRIDARKGQKLVLEAADLLHERNPEILFHIVGSAVDGTATKVYEAQCHEFVQQRKLQNVAFSPYTETPTDTIDRCDILVFTPTEAEPFGRTVIEAMNLGKMVIAFDQIGPREIFADFFAFLDIDPDQLESSPLVKNQNVMSLAETIAYYADNPSKMKLFTEKSQAFVKAKYSRKFWAKKFWDTVASSDSLN